MYTLITKLMGKTTIAEVTPTVLPAPSIDDALKFLTSAVESSDNQFKSHIMQRIAEIKRYI